MAIALVRMGRRADGQALWASVLPLMQAQRQQEVLDRYEAALSDRPWVIVP